MSDKDNFVESYINRLRAMGKEVVCKIGNVILIRSKKNIYNRLSNVYDKYTIIKGCISIEYEKYDKIKIDKDCIHCKLNGISLYDIIFYNSHEIHSILYYFSNDKIQLYYIYDNKFNIGIVNIKEGEIKSASFKISDIKVGLHFMLRSFYREYFDKNISCVNLEMKLKTKRSGKKILYVSSEEYGINGTNYGYINLNI